MKAIVQRVTSAGVSVEGEVVSTIGRGLCVLVGIHRDDTPQQRETLVRKILNLRIFDDESTGKRWNKSAKDLGLEILCVSQFTLYCQMKGNKPDYRFAMGGEAAQNFYTEFLQEMKKGYGAAGEEKIKNGVFGAYMQVDIKNDGPVTIDLDIPPPSKVDKDTENAQSVTQD